MTDTRLRSYVRVVHPFLSVYLPFMFFLIVCEVLVGGVFAMYEVEVFPPFFPVILLLAGLTEAVSSNLLARSRISGITPRLREAFFVLLVSFGLILLLYGDLTSGDIDLSRFNIWLSLIVVLGQWLFSLQIHSRLRERELFLGFFEGKDPRSYGDIYSTYNHEAGQAFKALGGVRRTVIGFIAVVFVLLIIATWAVGLELGGVERMLFFGFFLTFFYITSLLERYRDMLRVLMSGHAVTPAHARIKNTTMLLIFGVVAVIAIPLAGRQAWLPSSYLVAFGEWLTDVTRWEFEPGEVRAPEVAPGPTMDDTFDRMSDFRDIMGERDSGPGIARYVGYTLLGLIGLGFLAFLLMPILRIRGSDLNLRQALSESLRSLVTGLKAGWAKLVGTLRLAARQGRQVGEFLTRERRDRESRGQDGATDRRRIDRRERRIHGRLMKSFTKFVRWAARHDVTFDPSIAPREFSEMISRKVPDRRGDCMEIAELFEEIVYSDHRIGEEIHERYHEKVSAVVRGR